MSSAPAPSNKTSSAVPSEDVLSAKASARRGMSRTSWSYPDAVAGPRYSSTDGCSSLHPPTDRHPYTVLVTNAFSLFSNCSRILSRFRSHECTRPIAADVTLASLRRLPPIAGLCSVHSNTLAKQSDICVSNAIVKTGIGFGAGVVCSAILFRRRPWPVLVGLGFGLGQGYSDCERVFNPAAVPAFVIAKDGKPQASPYANFNPFGSKASEAKDKAEDKVSQVVDKVKDSTKQVVGKAEAVKDKAENKLGDKKWV